MTDSRLARFAHIAIEGPIGAGKTTLAQRLAARIDAEPLLEQPADNPFLGRFYDDMAGYAFQTQLFFLFQRQKQLQAIAQPSMFARTVVSDFMFAKDAVFAKLTLSDDEYRLYAQMHAPIAAQLPQPDLVIWLRASPPALLRRVQQRGVVIEQAIDLGYLDRLARAYAEFFDGYQGAPVYAIDSERFDPREEAGDLDRLLAALDGFAGRRGFFARPADAVLD